MRNNNLVNSVMLLLFALLIWLPAAMQTGWQSWVALFGFYFSIAVACYPGAVFRGGR